MTLSGTKADTQEKQIPFVQSDKKLGLLGRDFLPKHDTNSIVTEHMPVISITELM